MEVEVMWKCPEELSGTFYKGDDKVLTTNKQGIHLCVKTYATM
jgi:hypothetical protein